MEAAATPLPREDTTPPVTKMYFGAVRKVACESPECLRTSNYAFARSVCQIANRDARNLFFTLRDFFRCHCCDANRFSTFSISPGTSTAIAS
jgi:hypothetical protein